MKVCIIGSGAGGRGASGRIRELDKQAQIDIFNAQIEIGYKGIKSLVNSYECKGLS